MSLLFGGRGEKRSMAWWAADVPPTGRRVVNEQSATHLGPVFAAIRHIIDFGSTLPINCYREMDDGTRKPAPLPQIIRNQDAPGYPGVVSWVGQAFYGLSVHGNAVGWIDEVDGYGFPSDVLWLRRQDWEYDFSNRQWVIYGSPVASSRILHIPWIVPSGQVLGLSPIEHAATTIAAGLSAQEYADVKRGGGIPPTVLRNNMQTLDNEQSETVRERAVAAFTSGKPFVTGKDWDLTVPSIPPNQAKFVETLQMSANQVAAMYGIDPREVGGTATDSLTYSTDESKTLNRASNMRPYIERFERAISRYLPERQCIAFDIESTIRTDIKTLTETLGWEVADGRRSVNEARAMKNLPPVDGGDRHNFYSPANQPAARPALEPTRSEPSSEGEHHERR